MDQAEIEAKLATLSASVATLNQNIEAQRQKQMTAYWKWIEESPSKHSAAGKGMAVATIILALAEVLAYLVGHFFKWF